MKNILFILLSLLAFTPACNHVHQGGGHAEVRLNNGKKWEANSETTEGIENMQRLIGEFQSNPDAPSLEGYHTLGEALQTEFDNILKRCTMEGEAHEQLHNYLLPMVKHMKTLKEGKGQEEIKASLARLSEHLKEYENYFT